MIKLHSLTANQTELEIGAKTIFFSYETPVAGHHPDIGHFKTDEWYSQTTTKHINKYFKDQWGLDSANIESVKVISQDSIDQMVGVKLIEVKEVFE